MVEQLVEASPDDREVEGSKPHIQRKIFIALTLAGSHSRGQKTSSDERELASGCLETPFPEVDLPGFDTDGGVESGLRIRLTLQMDPLGKDLSCNFSEHPFYL